MTIPAIEPPLRPELSSLASALDVSAPAVDAEPATVMVLTCPPEVVSLTILPVVVVEEVELVEVVDVPPEPPSVLVGFLLPTLT